MLLFLCDNLDLNKLDFEFRGKGNDQDLVASPSILLESFSGTKIYYFRPCYLKSLDYL